MTGDRIVAAARGWLGVPWRHQGRSRRGVDCVGLVVCVARELGHEPEDFTAYARHADTFDFAERFRRALREVPVAEAQPGDVLVFAERAFPCHCAVLSRRHGVPHLIHAHALRRRVIEEPLAGEWPARLRMAFRFPFVE